MAMSLPVHRNSKRINMSLALSSLFYRLISDVEMWIVSSCVTSSSLLLCDRIAYDDWLWYISVLLWDLIVPLSRIFHLCID